MLMRRVFSENRHELARSYVKPKRQLLVLRQLKILQPFCFAVMLLVTLCRNLCSSVDPLVLQGKNKNHLPVFWRAKRHAQVDRKMFMDWSNNCFVHEVQQYLAQNNLALKAFLILHSVPGYPETVRLAHPNIGVILLPPNTTSHPITRSSFCSYL